MTIPAAAHTHAVIAAATHRIVAAALPGAARTTAAPPALYKLTHTLVDAASHGITNTADTRNGALEDIANCIGDLATDIADGLEAAIKGGIQAT